MNVAIDGPAGAGKSTIARRVAESLGSIYIDTGAMYRAMAFHMVETGIDPEDEASVIRALPDVSIGISHTNGEQHVILNGKDVTPWLREERVGNMASRISRIPEVRTKLVALQQEIARKQPVVMDGRDIGTVVLPDAECKIFLTASAAVRADRRYRELLEKQGKDPVLDWDPEERCVIEEEIIERDKKDMTRAASPLRMADDAVCVDSSDLSIEEVTRKILELAGRNV